MVAIKLAKIKPELCVDSLNVLILYTISCFICTNFCFFKNDFKLHDLPVLPTCHYNFEVGFIMFY